MVEMFRAALADQWERYEALRRHSFDGDVLGDIARDAAEIAVGNLFWHLTLGDCLRATEVAEKSGHSESEIVKRVRDGLLVGMEGRYTTFLPRWQFPPGHGPEYGPEPSKTVREVLAAFRQALGDQFRPETVLSWASTPQPDLGEKEPRERAAVVDYDHDVVRAAQRAARRLVR